MVEALSLEAAIKELRDEAPDWIFKERYATKIRRILQIIHDLAGSFENLRILDLGCAEGLYSLEAAVLGSDVTAIDGRMSRMQYGIKIAEKLILSKIKFIQEDIRDLSEEKYGKFDVILLLGLLYHFDVPDVFQLLSLVHQMCKNFIVIDTHISLTSEIEVAHRGCLYWGSRYTETGGDVSAINNRYSFWFTSESLFRLLNEINFASIFECCIPLEPTKPANRITLVAIKGDHMKISSYPWINDISEEDIQARMEG